jgi:hypothetical protein
MAVIPRRTRRRLVSWLIAVAATLSSVVGIAILLLLYRIVPPITGRVTDALTGDAIAGVNVTFEMNRWGWGSQQPFLHDVSSTRPSGRFWLSGFFRWQGAPIPNYGDYWLTVNQVPEHGEDEYQGIDSAEFHVLRNPISNRRGQVADAQYFPVAVTLDPSGCQRVWPAMCLFRRFWWGVSVPLIPVLDDGQRCNAISDASVRERCRQLNTYRAAFLLAGTFDDAQQSRRLCAEVDHGPISELCLERVRVQENHPTPRPAEPRLAGLFAEAIGEGVRTRQDCDPKDNYSGHLWCQAVYEDSDMERLVIVTFQEWVDQAVPIRQAIPPKPDYNDYYRAAIVRETRPGGIIRLYRGPVHTFADWPSNNRYVHLEFQRRFATQSAFIEQYLAKFPSTMR